MTPINSECVKKYHSALIAESGGSDGVRSADLLESAIASAFQTFGGEELFPSTTAKIARIAYGIINNHPFVDGNKRTGTHVMVTLLKAYGFDVDFTNDDIVKIGLALAKGEMDDGQLDELIRGRVRC